MVEMRDAVTFMYIFLDFKTVEPATTAAGGQLQPFSFTVAHVMRKEKKGSPFLPFFAQLLQRKVLHIIRSTFIQQRWVILRTQIVALPA